MANNSHPRTAILQMHISEFWSGDIGLTLVSLSLVVLIFVIFPLRQAGLSGRVFFDLVMVSLMISGALATKQNRIVTVMTVALVIVGAVLLWAARFYPTPSFDSQRRFPPSLVALMSVSSCS